MWDILEALFEGIIEGLPWQIALSILVIVIIIAIAL